MKTLTKRMANKVYDVLVTVCGARESERECFVSHHMTEDIDRFREWRFCGHLGFGGKFWVNDGRMYVNCYNEDLNPSRQKIIDEANKKLEAL